MNTDIICCLPKLDPSLKNVSNFLVTSADRSVSADFRAFQLFGISDGILGGKGGKLTDLPYKYRNKTEIKVTTFLYIKISMKTSFYY